MYILIAIIAGIFAILGIGGLLALVNSRFIHLGLLFSSVTYLAGAYLAYDRQNLIYIGGSIILGFLYRYLFGDPLKRKI